MMGDHHDEEWKVVVTWFWGCHEEWMKRYVTLCGKIRNDIWRMCGVTGLSGKGRIIREKRQCPQKDERQVCGEIVWGLVVIDNIFRRNIGWLWCCLFCLFAWSIRDENQKRGSRICCLCLYGLLSMCVLALYWPKCVVGGNVVSHEEEESNQRMLCERKWMCAILIHY